MRVCVCACVRVCVRVCVCACVCACACAHLAEGLLQPALLGHGQRAHRVPAAPQLLHLGADPGGVVVAAVHQLPGRALQGLDAHRPLAQLLLEHLRRRPDTQRHG